MHGLLCVYFAFSLLLLASAAYDIDKVYEMQPGSKPFFIYNENYPSNYPIGKRYRYQITVPSYYKVRGLCSANIGYNGNVCSPDDIFIYLDDGTTDLYSDQSMSGCGKFDGISIVSRYNSITFGAISKWFSGNFSCQISISLSSTPCDCGWHIDTKIYNGTQAKQNSLAPLAGLYSENIKSIFCGCTLITENFALTAAHCLLSKPMNEISKMWLVAGRDNVTISDPNYDTHYAYNYKVISTIPHENYNTQTYANDIGLVKTMRMMSWNRGVSPGCLPSTYDTEDQYIGEAVTYAGWGFTQPDGHPSAVLLATSVTVCPIDYCRNELQDNSITTSQTCTLGYGKHDACQMDSGGPALYYDKTILRYIVYGISSFGPICGVNKPAVCTLVAAYLNWIKPRIQPMQSLCLSYN